MVSELVSDAAPGGEKRTNVALSSGVLIRAARGFSCIFWGIPLGLLLFSGALDLRVFPRLRMPAYVFGIFLVYCGLMFLQRTGPLSAHWLRRVREAMFVLLVEVYLAPFVFWWRQMPHVPYYIANVLALILCTTLGLFLVNLLAGELGRALHDRTFLVESRLSAAISVLFMMVPVLGSVFDSIRATLQLESMLDLDLAGSPFAFPRWAYAFSLLPFTLTMAIAWKAKERCLLVLKTSYHVPAPPPEKKE
jgi:hypothetical protein